MLLFPEMPVTCLGCISYIRQALHSRISYATALDPLVQNVRCCMYMDQVNLFISFLYFSIVKWRYSYVCDKRNELWFALGMAWTQQSDSYPT